MTELPSGTLTFLFTDLEGSTGLWEAQPAEMRDAVARHDGLLAGCVEANGGVVVKTTGDGLVAVFAAASDGVAAAFACQRALATEPWPLPIKARMGLYTGEAAPVDGDYHAPVLNRAARVMSAGHGGQVLLSSTTATLAATQLPEGAGLKDLGEHRLRDLGQPEVLHQLTHRDLPRRFPRLRTLDALPGNLPLQVSSFLGRAAEIDRCRGALSTSRVVTLTGVGGVGKTRLALQVAGEVLPRYRDGAWLVELAAVRDPDAVRAAVAAELGLNAGGNVAASLLELLAGKKLLLVLDNCEHLLDAVAALVSAIELTCPRVAVLATSREPLAIDGEQVLGLPSLPIDIAAELFTERATAYAPGSVLAGDDDAVRRVCRRLDGMPLAIELAAARARSMTPAQLAERLENRFAVLAGGRRGAVERHQTLRAMVDWSYDLLSDKEQCLLNRVSVFVGGWTLESAEEVCSIDPIEEYEVFDLLDSLVSRSLVVAERRGSMLRYRLLETIRQYAEEKLAAAREVDTTAMRHGEHYARFAAEVEVQGRGRDRADASLRWKADHDNYVSALGHAIAAEATELALRLVVNGISDWRETELAALPIEEALGLPDAVAHPSTRPRSTLSRRSGCSGATWPAPKHTFRRRRAGMRTSVRPTLRPSSGSKRPSAGSRR